MFASRQLEFRFDDDREARANTDLSSLSPATQNTLGAPICYSPREDGLPVTKPLDSAVGEGYFGLSLDGPISPEEGDVIALTEEVADDLVGLYCELISAKKTLATCIDPSTGEVIQNNADLATAHTFLENETIRIRRVIDETLEEFALPFGKVAAIAIDEWAANTALKELNRVDQYPPDHPWHYLPWGDGARPLPVGEIPASHLSLDSVTYRLPKTRAKRDACLRQRLADERANLEHDRMRYQEIVERGAEALSRYDREIANSSDEMARAQALALKYRHISLAIGRIAWLEKELRIGTSIC